MHTSKEKKNSIRNMRKRLELQKLNMTPKKKTPMLVGHGLMATTPVRKVESCKLVDLIIGRGRPKMTWRMRVKNDTRYLDL